MPHERDCKVQEAIAGIQNSGLLVCNCGAFSAIIIRDSGRLCPNKETKSDEKNTCHAWHLWPGGGFI